MGNISVTLILWDENFGSSLLDESLPILSKELYP